MAFLGMRGTGNWGADERPLNWRQGILYLYPNGMAPLTALLSKMPEEKVDDPQFHWWTKGLPNQGGAVTQIFTNAGLSINYVSGAVAGDTLYFRMAEATADEFRVGHQALIRDADHLDVDVNVKVTAVVKNGGSSYVAGKLLEADDNGATTDLSNADTILIIGNINAEGAPMPDAIAYDPTKFFNYTQIFRNPLDITRTARRTHLRTGDAYKEAKREALEQHSIEMEKAFFFGVRSENTGTNGKPERTTMGLVNFIKIGAPANVKDFTLDTAFSGKTWLQSGEEWFDGMLELIFRFGGTEKMIFAGSGAILGINRLVKSSGQMNISPTTTSYGLKVLHWMTPFGDVFLKTHPLFSYDATMRNTMIIVEPRYLRYRYIDDTMFIEDDGKHGQLRKDGTTEEYLTECGLELHHPTTMGMLSGIGQNNVV